MILHGDCLVELKTLPEASIDACVTDPPYGIGFMGKKWDTFNPDVARASKAFAIGHGDKGRADAINPNLRGRRQSPAMSPSQIEYDRSLAGQHEFQAWTELWAREVFRVVKPGAHVLVCGAPRSYHRMTSGLEDAGFEIRDCLAWIFGQGFPKSLNFPDGAGTALKPAYEPIVMARKPFKGNVETNRATHGTGAINIDACRIGVAEGKRFPSSRGYVGGGMQPGIKARDLQQVEHDGRGRWPSNVAMDEAAAELLDEQSGELTSGDYSGERSSDKTRAIFGTFAGTGPRVEGGHAGDRGGASRFFYVAKPSRAERDAGCHELDPQQRDESRKAGDPGGDNPRNRGLQRRGNSHPTVKPVELMRWLVRLVTPPNGTVLDPFCGSGTTGMACAFEGRPFIGIEREADYVAIAERRIASCMPLFSAG